MSKQALELVRKLFVAVADREEITEQQRQILAAMDNFEAGVCFSKLDQDQKGYVSKEDILSLLTSNGITDVSEQSISYMIKYFDSMENDKLNMNDFTQILLPCANDYLRSRASNRRLHHEVDAFSKEVQGQLSTLIQKECEYHTEIESIKKEIASSENYDPKEIFRAIDTNMHDFLDSNTIEEFLKSQGFKASKTDLNSIIRRFDVTADARISYTEFAEGITQANIPLSLPQEFSKPGYPYNNLRNTPQPNLNSMEPQKMPNFEKRDYGMEYQQPSPYRAEKYPPPQREEYDPKMPRMKYQEFVQPRQSYPNSITGGAETETSEGYYSQQEKRHSIDKHEHQYRFEDYKRGFAEQSRAEYNSSKMQGRFNENSFPQDQRFSSFDKDMPQRNSFTSYQGFRNEDSKFQAPIEPFRSQDQKYESPSRKQVRFEEDIHQRYQLNSSSQMNRHGSYYPPERQSEFEDRSRLYDNSSKQNFSDDRNSPYKASRVQYKDYDVQGSPSRYQSSPISQYKRKEYPVFPGGYSNMATSIPQEEMRNFRTDESPIKYNKYRYRDANEGSPSRYQAQLPDYLRQSPNKYNIERMNRKQELLASRDAPIYDSHKYSNHTKTKPTYEDLKAKYSEPETKRPKSEYGRSSMYKNLPTIPASYQDKASSKDYKSTYLPQYNREERYSPYRPSTGYPPSGMNLSRDINPSRELNFPRDMNPQREMNPPIGFGRPQAPPPADVRPKTPPRHTSIANPNESADKAPLNTPPKATKQSKGAFNMIVSPETATKSGDGWSFVPSPDVSKKEGPPRNIRDAPKGPLRI